MSACSRMVAGAMGRAKLSVKRRLQARQVADLARRPAREPQLAKRYGAIPF